MKWYKLKPGSSVWHVPHQFNLRSNQWLEKEHWHGNCDAWYFNEEMIDYEVHLQWEHWYYVKFPYSMEYKGFVATRSDIEEVTEPIGTWS